MLFLDFSELSFEVAVLLDAEPLLTCTILPLSVSLRGNAVLLRDGVFTESMLLSVLPVAFVDSSVGPGVDPVSMFLVLKVLAFVPSAIAECIPSEAMHVPVVPLSAVGPSISPYMDSQTVDDVIRPLTDVPCLIVPHVDSTPFFLTLNIFSEVFSPVGPYLMAFTMLDAIPPPTSVEGPI